MAKRKRSRKKAKKKAKRKPKRKAKKKPKRKAKKKPKRKAKKKRPKRRVGRGRLVKAAAKRRAARRKAVKKAVGRARGRVRKAAKRGAKKIRKAAKKARAKGVKKVKEALPAVTVRKTAKVRDPKERAFEKGPGFHKRTSYRPSNIDEPGFCFVAHEISDDGEAFNQYLHYDQLYNIRHGQNSKFFMNLLDGKIIGTRCPKCGDAWVPPRTNCWNLDCDLQETEWVEFPLRAKVHTWTIAGWSGRSSLKRLPLVLVYANIEGSIVAIANELHNIDPWDVEFGMPLEVVFIPKEERTGSVQDFYFVPAKDWKPGPMTPEKERIKKMVEPVYKWVKTLK
jgi:uncharacterized OB-fold protein